MEALKLVLTLYRICIFCFQMCNRLPEMMKNGDVGIFPVYYSLKMENLQLDNKELCHEMKVLRK